MHAQAGVVAAVADFVADLGRINRAAGHIVRAFQTDERGLRAIVNLGTDQRLDDVPGEDAVFDVGGARHAAGDGGDRVHLVLMDVAALFDDHFVAVMRPCFHGNQIAHGACGHKNGGLAPEDFGGARLQLVDRRIFSVDIVADDGLGHGAAHLRRRPRDGVTAQIDGGSAGGLLLGLRNGLRCRNWIHGGPPCASLFVVAAPRQEASSYAALKGAAT